MRVIRSVAGIVAVVLMATACTGGDDGDGVVTFQVTADAEEAAVYRTMVAAFNDAHPDVDVRLVAVADKDDHLQKLTTSFAGGRPPDVFLVNFREFSQFVVRGALQAAGPLLEEAGLDTGDYYEPPLEAFTYEGELQCWPQNVSSLVIYYNQDIFRKAGLKHPGAWTLEDLRASALRIKEAVDEGDLPSDVDALGIDSSPIGLAPFIWSNGGDIVDDLTTPKRFTLEEPAAREVLEFFISLVQDDGVVPSEGDIAAQDLETRFATGKLGMFLSSRRDTPVFREQLELQWDVAPLPVVDEPASILHSDAYCFSHGAGDLDEAVAFAAFALSEEGQQITALGGRTVPSLVSVSESGAFLDPIQPPEHAQVFLDAIPILRRTPVIPTWTEIEDIAQEYLLRAYYDRGYDLDEALSDLDAQARDLFEEGSQP
jgi:multiple sugar transport system substrate-binding protein